MSFDLPLTVNALTFLAVVGRVSGFMMAMPVFGGDQVPMRYRALLSMAIAVLLFPLVPDSWSQLLNPREIGFIHLIIIMGMEMLMGLLVTFAVRIMLEIFSMAGLLCGIFMGMGFARQVDPTLGTQNSIISIALTQVMLMVIIISGFHLEIIRLVSASFSVGPGMFQLTDGVYDFIIMLMTKVFVVGFQLALPLFCMTMFMNVCLALMTRFGEEFQVLMISFPVKIGLGLIVLAAAMPVFIYVGRDTAINMLENLSDLFQ